MQRPIAGENKIILNCFAPLGDQIVCASRPILAATALIWPKDAAHKKTAIVSVHLSVNSRSMFGSEVNLARQLQVTRSFL
jgi:hypothetical protein